MFEERALPTDVSAVRADHVPNALVLDAGSDFETLSTARLDDLAARVENIHPHEYDPSWVTADSPELLHRLATSDFVVGMPGDGSVAWTTQTTPPVVIVKPRVEGSPEDFVDFLVAEALVEAGASLPEHFLGFFRDRYSDFADAIPGDPNTTYQIAVAVCDAYRGLHTRDVFETWPDEHPRLGDAWTDAGERLQTRLDDLPASIARHQTHFADAAELACAGIKHGLDVPAPFAALDTLAFRDHGVPFAVRWAEKVFD